MNLAKRRKEQHSKGGALIIKLERFPDFHDGMPWGLELDADTLRFRKCTKESVADVFYSTLQNAVGMELDTINGRAVRNLEQVERQPVV